ncbi:MAG: hypothetical protein ACK4NC_03710 [Candidatus Gracilibacteria bacterium]
MYAKQVSPELYQGLLLNSINDKESLEINYGKQPESIKVHFNHKMQELLQMTPEQFFLYKELLMLYQKYYENIDSIVYGMLNTTLRAKRGQLSYKENMDNISEFSRLVLTPKLQAARASGISENLLKQLYPIAAAYCSCE